MLRLCRLLSIPVMICTLLPVAGLASTRPYRAPEAVSKALQKTAGSHPKEVRLHTLAHSPEKRPVEILEIGGGKTGKPAILVAANLEGNSPVASEAAMALIAHLTGDWKSESEKAVWYICPVGNPDGYARFFKTPLDLNFRNGRPFNEDGDDAEDEDGPEDLNGDGWITTMRQKHPEGMWMELEGTPLLKKADPAKGEPGIYRIFPEGTDNDRDGQINEDGPGGFIPGHNFPHRFQYYSGTDGPWPASEEESRALLRFAFDHPEIGMVIVFGASNTLREVPEQKSGAQAAQEKVQVTGRMSRWLGVEEGEYAVKELLQIARDATGNPTMTEEELLQWVGGGAAMNPATEDASVWKEVTERYAGFLKQEGLDAKRIAPPGPSPGSIEEWAYFQFGVMAFAMDFWTLPEARGDKAKEGGLSADRIESMSPEDFLGLGEARIDSLLKAADAARLTAAMVREGFENKRMTTKRIADMMRKASKKEGEGGSDEKEKALLQFDPESFVPWKPFHHPDLGPVEIGGQIPYRMLCPPDSLLEKIIEKQLPFVKNLAGWMPVISIPRVEIKNIGPDVWRMDAWVENTGFFPYPTHQGIKNRRPVTAVMTLSGKPKILEGMQRVVLGVLKGSGGTGKASWLLQGQAGSTVTLTVQTMSAGQAEKPVILKGGVQ